MSIEYSTAICFGVVVSEETVERIIDHISKEFDSERAYDFIDEHCRQIDSWAGGDYFLGFIEDCGDAAVVPLDMAATYECIDFDELISEWGISDIITIEYLPRTCIVTFCY